jgi:murein DD-endopeptidase MepM/ murein hydrolase activator NlpD
MWPGARRRISNAAVAVALVVLTVATPWPAAAVGAAGEPGASPATPEVVGPVVPGAYSPPVRAPVRDPFRMDSGPYGPGNRGLEYDSVAGEVVRAIGSGRVLFAGPVAGRWAVTVLHPDGRRSSLTGVHQVRVRVGDLVVRSQVLALAGERLHLGVREGERYIDPATLFAVERRRAVLVPLGAAHGG